MKISDIIDSLIDQISDRESLIPKDDPDSIFAHDAEALREAVKVLQRLEQPDRVVVPSVAAMTFIGKDGSMGLQYGKRYTVYVNYTDELFFVSWDDGSGGIRTCPYTSMKTLTDNWQTKPLQVPQRKNPYRIIAKHLFRAHRAYGGGKTLVILADDIDEAVTKARAAFGVSTVIVKRVDPTKDPQVYEV